MTDDHIYRVMDRDKWINDIVRAIKGMSLDHLDKNTKRRVISESKKYY